MITCSNREYAFEYIRQVLEKIPARNPMYFVEYVGEVEKDLVEYMVSRTEEEMMGYVMDEMFWGFRCQDFEVWRYVREEENREIARLVESSYEKVHDSYGVIFRERIVLDNSEMGLVLVN